MLFDNKANYTYGLTKAALCEHINSYLYVNFSRAVYQFPTKRNTTDLDITTVHNFRSYSHESKGNTVLFNPLNAELNPIYHLLALLGAHHIFHLSRIRVKTISKLTS